MFVAAHLSGEKWVAADKGEAALLFFLKGVIPRREPSPERSQSKENRRSANHSRHRRLCLPWSPSPQLPAPKLSVPTTDKVSHPGKQENPGLGVQLTQIVWVQGHSFSPSRLAPLLLHHGPSPPSSAFSIQQWGFSSPPFPFALPRESSVPANATFLLASPGVEFP